MSYGRAAGWCFLQAMDVHDPDRQKKFADGLPGDLVTIGFIIICCWAWLPSFPPPPSLPSPSPRPRLSFCLSPDTREGAGLLLSILAINVSGHVVSIQSISRRATSESEWPGALI